MLRHELHIQVFEGINENVNVLLIASMINTMHFFTHLPCEHFDTRSRYAHRDKYLHLQFW